MKTAQGHRTHLRKRILPLLGDRKVSEIGLGDVQSLHDACLEAKRPLGTRAIEMTIGTLARILAYAEAQGLVEGSAVAAWKRARGRRRNGAASR